jgi:hypothetical protein
MLNPASRNHTGSIESCNVVCSKYACHYASNRSTNGMKSENVMTVINIKDILKFGAEITQDSCDNADWNGSKNWDESTGRSNSYE